MKCGSTLPSPSPLFWHPQSSQEEVELPCLLSPTIPHPKWQRTTRGRGPPHPLELPLFRQEGLAKQNQSGERFRSLRAKKRVATQKAVRTRQRCSKNTGQKLGGQKHSRSYTKRQRSGNLSHAGTFQRRRPGNKGKYIYTGGRGDTQV